GWRSSPNGSPPAPPPERPRAARAGVSGKQTSNRPPKACWSSGRLTRVANRAARNWDRSARSTWARQANASRTSTIDTGTPASRSRGKNASNAPPSARGPPPPPTLTSPPAPRLAAGARDGPRGQPVARDRPVPRGRRAYNLGHGRLPADACAARTPGAAGGRARRRGRGWADDRGGADVRPRRDRRGLDGR